MGRGWMSAACIGWAVVAVGILSGCADDGPEARCVLPNEMALLPALVEMRVRMLHSDQSELIIGSISDGAETWLLLCGPHASLHAYELDGYSRRLITALSNGIVSEPSMYAFEIRGRRVERYCGVNEFVIEGGAVALRSGDHFRVNRHGDSDRAWILSGP